MSSPDAIIVLRNSNDVHKDTDLVASMRAVSEAGCSSSRHLAVSLFVIVIAVVDPYIKTHIPAHSNFFYLTTNSMASLYDAYLLLA